MKQVFARSVAVVAAMSVATTGFAAGVEGSGVDGAVAPADSVGAEPFVASGPFADGRVLVRFHGDVSARRAGEAIDAVDGEATAHEPPSGSDTVVVELADDVAVMDAIATLRSDPAVDVVEPDYLISLAASADDPSYLDGSQWNMAGDSLPSPDPSNAYGSQAAEAWADGHHGSSAVSVAIIDSGVQIAHPDLDGNIWANPFETVNGLDDDGNGYVDDINGWDFAFNDNSVYDSIADSHGTHVAGTIGAEGNNGVGVSGVNWDVNMIVVKTFDNGSGRISDVIRGFDYLVDLQKRHPSLNMAAISAGWSQPYTSELLLSAIDRAGDAGILVVAPSGDNGQVNEVAPQYPTSGECTSGGRRSWDCIVSVGAHNATGALSLFSNVSDTSVDISAPGEAVRSTFPTSSYGAFASTSLASPHVVGAIALCKAKSPAMTAPLIRQALLASAVPTPSLSGKNVTGGRLDISAMLDLCPAGAAPTGAPSNLQATAAGANRVELTWTDGVTGETSFEVQRSLRVGAVCGTWTTVAVTIPGVVAWTDRTAPPATAVCYRVRGANTRAGGSTTAFTAPAVVTTAAGLDALACAPVGFAWNDIATTGTAVSFVNGDEGTSAVTLPFPFSFAGSNRTSALVSPNGFIGFGTVPATTFSPLRIPSTAGPNGIIAPYWTQLAVGVSGFVRTKTIGASPNRTFVISWINMNSVFINTRFTFQLVLHEGTGVFDFMYADIDGASFYEPWDTGQGNVASVGAEDDAGLTGVRAPIPRTGLVDKTGFRCSRIVRPGAARSPTAKPGNRSVKVSWKAPTSTGGSAISTYVVSAAPGGATCTTSGALSCTVAGLKNGTRYTFSVRAANGHAVGTAATVTATPRTRPGAPRSVKATAGAKRATVTWAAPSSTGGSPITTYTVTSKPGNTTCTTRGPRTCTVTGLAKGTGYTFTVTAKNAAGQSPKSAASNRVVVR